MGQKFINVKSESYVLAKTRTKKYCEICAEEVKRGRVKNE